MPKPMEGWPTSRRRFGAPDEGLFGTGRLLNKDLSSSRTAEGTAETEPPGGFHSWWDIGRDALRAFSDSIGENAAYAETALQAIPIAGAVVARGVSALDNALTMTTAAVGTKDLTTGVGGMGGGVTRGANSRDMYRRYTDNNAAMLGAGVGIVPPEPAGMHSSQSGTKTGGYGISMNGKTAGEAMGAGASPLIGDETVSRLETFKETFAADGPVHQLFNGFVGVLQTVVGSLAKIPKEIQLTLQTPRIEVIVNTNNMQTEIGKVVEAIIFRDVGQKFEQLAARVDTLETKNSPMSNDSGPTYPNT
jgi:hypothetical protein